MAETSLQTTSLSQRAKIWGTIFLLFQLLFAANNYGPQRIPGLNLIFDEPWVAPHRDASLASTSPVEFEPVAEAGGLEAFQRAPFYDANPRYLEVMGGGVAVGDYDGDGWEDVFFTSLPAFGDSATTSVSPSTLFRNQGDGTFEDVTASVALDAIEGYPQGALFFDFDNDGDQDLYVAAYEGGQLFRNEDGQFEDVTGSAGLDLDGRCGVFSCFASSAAAADYNRDGLLDLLVVNNVDWDLDDPAHQGPRRLFPAFFEPQPSLLFENNGDGTFTEVSRESGLTNEGGKGLAAVWLDFNNDDWPDVYIANDLSRNTLYLNNQDGTFTEFGAGAEVDEIKSSMGVAAADVDHDGHLDLATTNLKGSKVSLFRNQGDLRFDYVTNHTGLSDSRRASGWGIAFVDLDLDGHLDLVTSGGPVWEEEPGDTQNLFFRNRGDGTFEEVTETSGAPLNHHVSRGLAVLDVDRSGRPDLVFANVDGASPLLLKNRPRTENRWLKVHLEGIASNRDGVGARVVVQRADSLRLMQEVRAGDSYQSASTKTLFFGLGQSEAESMTVRWPSGTVDTLRQLPVNEAIRVREGSGWTSAMRSE